ncbi:hypothetical protein CAEBREN_19276 [Caenorhabditis brenneri]|uniref:Uncharacterized protein n=1 Tax=Caenorhabditis brenneri TaxID=135651 RepID=G0MHR4_CAEBE|nr:hypothetical protein CAEBREN_19276 [Caenorhabditis brenneri]
MSSQNEPGGPNQPTKSAKKPEFMKVPTNREFVFHKIASRCSLLFDACVAAMEQCTDEGINNMMYAYEGSYEGIVNMESALIEKYLNYPIRCRDTECNNKMEYLPTYGMRIWNLNGHIVATPENFIVIEQKDYHRQLAPPSLTVALGRIISKKTPFKSVNDYTKIQAEVQNLLADQIQTMKSTLYNIISELKQHGRHQTVLSLKLINNLEKFAKDYMESADVSTLLLTENDKLIADREKKEIPEKKYPLKSVANGDVTNVPRDYISKEVRKLQDAIKNIHVKDEVTLSPVFFEDGSMKARLSVHNVAAPSNLAGNGSENPKTPAEDPLQPGAIEKTEKNYCENHPVGLPPSVLWKYKKIMHSKANPYAVQDRDEVNPHAIQSSSAQPSDQGPSSEAAIAARKQLFDILTQLKTATTRAQNEKDEVHSQPGTSTDIPNWHGEGTSSQNQPSTSTSPVVVEALPEVKLPKQKKNTNRKKTKSAESITKSMQPKSVLPQNREK